MKKILVLCLCFFLLASIPVLANKELTVTECIQISDTELIIKFSEPVAVNLHDTNRGPWIALRIVDGGHVLQYDGANPLQYQGECSFVGSSHDTILFKYGSEGVLTSTDVINFQNGIDKYYKDGLKVEMCIEEVPYNTEGEVDDELIDNVTTLDGNTRLSANGPAGWDGIYTEIKVDFDYDIDLSNLEPLTSVDNYNYENVIAVGDAPEIVNEPEEKSVNYLWFAAGAAVIIAATAVIIIRRAGKKA